MSKAPNANAEYQRRWRQRQKQKRKEEVSRADLVEASSFGTPFNEWGAFESSDAEFCLALAGIQLPDIEDDSGPLDHVLNGAADGVEDPFPGATNSLGRAEVMLGCLISAAVEMASTINRYKASQITSRIEEIARLVLSDPSEQAAAEKEIVRLNKQLDQLKREIRWTFPQWKVSGA